MWKNLNNNFSTELNTGSSGRDRRPGIRERPKNPQNFNPFLSGIASSHSQDNIRILGSETTVKNSNDSDIDSVGNETSVKKMPLINTKEVYTNDGEDKGRLQSDKINGIEVDTEKHQVLSSFKDIFTLDKNINSQLLSSAELFFKAFVNAITETDASNFSQILKNLYQVRMAYQKKTKLLDIEDKVGDFFRTVFLVYRVLSFSDHQSGLGVDINTPTKLSRKQTQMRRRNMV